MKQHHLVFLLCTCALLVACGEKQTTDKSTPVIGTASKPASLCTLISASDIQTTFGQTVTVTTDTPEMCNYENAHFSVQLMQIDYHDVDAAKQGFKTLFAGKNTIANLGDEANSFRRGREIDKVSLRQGQRVLSISKTGGEYVEDGLQKLEVLLRQAHSQLP